MKKNLLGGILVIMAWFATIPAAHAAPVLESLPPYAFSFTFGAGLGAKFTVATGTGFGDVTSQLFAVDVNVGTPENNTSGCQAADFAGFSAGSIALIQRGDCVFGVKVANAIAAGASGVILFNDNDPTLGGDRVGAIEATLGGTVPVPVFFTSNSVGLGLLGPIFPTTGLTGQSVRMKVSAEDLVVPEPGTLALLGLGLAGLAATRRRRQ